MERENNRCYGCFRENSQHPVCEYCGWDERAQNDPHQLPTGTLLRDQYLIGRVLGQGGFGITYLAWDVYLHTPVAIKEYYPSSCVSRDSSVSNTVTCYSGPSSFQYEDNKHRFLSEGQSLARYKDLPHIVQIYSLFPENNTVYLVMEYVEGETLQQKLARSGPMKFSEVFAILKPVMEDLQKVHASGVIHRDISPDNIILTPSGTAKLLDFGAIRAVENPDQNSMLSKSTQAILKQGFAPLEQYNCRGSLGPWTDVYALCATICTCVTGQVPEYAPERAFKDNPDEFISHLTGFTDSQKEVIRRGMALRPKDRIADVKKLLELLENPSAAVPARKEASGFRDPDPTVIIPQNTEIPVWEQPQRTQSPVPEKRKPQKTAVPRKPVAPSPDQKPENPSRPPERRTPRPEKRRKGPSSMPEKKQGVTNRQAKMLVLVSSVVCAAVIGLLLTWGIHKKLARQKVTVTEETIAEIQQTCTQEFRETKPEDQPAEVSQSPRETILETAVPKVIAAREDRILKNTDPTGSSNVFLGTDVKKSEIMSITFLDSLESAPQDAADVSASGNGKVLLWTEAAPPEILVENPVNVFIAGEGPVVAPENSRYLFGGQEFDFFSDGCLDNLTDIRFNGAFDVSTASDLYGMFQCCLKLENLDLSDFDTSSAVNMDHMFAHCYNLHSLDLSVLETGKVVSMNSMFKECNLRSISLRNLDTSSLSGVRGMFEQCGYLETVDLTGFAAKNVTDFTDFFIRCSSLKALDLSSLCAGNVVNTENMFRGCSSLQYIQMPNIHGPMKVNSGMFDFTSENLSVEGDSVVTELLEASRSGND